MTDRVEKRDSSGRWAKGHQPVKSTGRPKGSKDRPKGPKIEQMAQIRAAQIVTDMMGKAAAVIDNAVSMPTEVIVMDELGGPKMDDNGVVETMMVGGDHQIAKWLIDRSLPKDFAMLAATIDADISTLDGVIEASNELVESMLNRTLPIEQCERVLRVLTDYAQLRAFEGIEQLRLIVEEHEEATENAAKGGTMPDGMSPMWGRLQAALTPQSTTANKTPAE